MVEVMVILVIELFLSPLPCSRLYEAEVPPIDNSPYSSET